MASTASPGGPWVVMEIWACEADFVLSDGGVHAVGCTMLLREVGGKLLTLDAESLSKWSPFYKKDVPDAFFFLFHSFHVCSRLLGNRHLSFSIYEKITYFENKLVFLNYLTI